MKMLLLFCLEKELSLSNMWFRRVVRREVTFRVGENETEIDFVLVKKECPWILQNVKAIPGELQHALVAADIDKGK